ncbi:MAG: glutamine-synthetase adenylyltransferase, partial [Caulobacteraceae bacterium]|nr:glutamine-synthetase adenylyltransferase [Caulobacteraceae bacterium]
MGRALGARLKPCGPIVDEAAAARAREAILAGAGEGGSRWLDEAWPALAPVFAASSYLAALARRSPPTLERLLATEPAVSLTKLLDQASAAGAGPDAERTLRRLKAELHLLTALCDLGGVWALTEVTGALTAFADVALKAALALAAAEARASGRLVEKKSGETD